MKFKGLPSYHSLMEGGEERMAKKQKLIDWQKEKQPEKTLTREELEKKFIKQKPKRPLIHSHRGER